VATQLRIEQVRKQSIEQVAFSFDFIALLAIASVLAGIGLITDSTVVIVASMLVLPIMGPVLGEYWPLDGCKVQWQALVSLQIISSSLLPSC
jgi:hypothetical protein